MTTCSIPCHHLIKDEINPQNQSQRPTTKAIVCTHSWFYFLCIICTCKEKREINNPATLIKCFPPWKGKEQNSR